MSGEREERDTPVAPGGTGWTPPSLPICPISPQEPPPDPERSLYYPLYLDLDLERGPWDDDEFDVDEGKVLGGGGDGSHLEPLLAPPERTPPTPPSLPTVEEGPVFALCMAGDGNQHTLAKWIAGLQQTNPVLGRTPVLFRLGEGDSSAGSPGDGDALRLEGPGAAKLEPPEEAWGRRAQGEG